MIKKFRLSLEELQQLIIEIQQAKNYLDKKLNPYKRKLSELEERRNEMHKRLQQRREEAWALDAKVSGVKAQSVGVLGILFGNDRSRQRDLQVNELKNRSREIYSKNEEEFFREKNIIQQESDGAWKRMKSFTWDQADVYILKKEVIIDG